MKRIIKVLFLGMIILFLIVFINRNNNYYENTNIIKEEAIKQFEKDLRDGKEIIPSHYITPKKDYNNKASIIGLKTSKIIEKIVKKTLNKMIRYIST